MKISIIIPTFNRKDLLTPCIDSIKSHTDLSTGNVEIIVVSNGCVDGTQDYVKSLGEPFKLVSFDDAIGYTRATNEGIKVSVGDYLIFFNNDNVLLTQPRNEWLKFLIEPFLQNDKVGITGPLQLHDDYADEDVIIGFCLCISRKVINDVGGLLDEVFSPGGGEDIDLCCKVRNKGYIVKQVPREGKLGYSHTNTGEFQIWHKNNQTFMHIQEYTSWYVKRNGFYNTKKYNKNIRLNIGSGGIEYPGYLSVDLYDKRANIIMDITKLDFDDDSVTELLALHVFEHLNPYKALDILKGWYKILKPGGKLIMEMPDIEQLCKRFVSAGTGERYGILNAMYGSVNTTDVGDPSDITSPHLFGWFPQSLTDHLTNAGFTNIVFEPEMHPHPESNLRVVATKSGAILVVKSMMHLWNYDSYQQPFPYGDTITYKKAADFLSDCETIEDWGCGTAYFKKFVPRVKYIGVDGSRSKFCDVLVDLQSYTSSVDGILMRHVLDLNYNWKAVLDNALKSFKKKFVLILYTPFSDTTKQIATNWSSIPDISFKKTDITDMLLEYSYKYEELETDTQYKQEHIFYIEKF